MTGQPRDVAGTATTLVIVLLHLAGAVPARAQAPIPFDPSDGWDNAYYQIMAKELRQLGLNKTVYSSDGHAVGRIIDVRTTPDGMHEAAIIRVRRLMGGGQIALPFYRLSKRDGRLVAMDDRATVSAMERLDTPGPGARR
ncbi:PRC-barrel domain-containing protein [Methylobacterium frigidaeris]|uniref:PRC-barrel domain-containing protein n=1 Tax=Methylobacterium frigidaeris TaxID=2038277 RepID=A0AA37HH44_9HYPH|nr:PRC-barrel domain-containing protein [Methylobacterium frigidaeris]GJD65699.1 hypothetical protein MPEAHAMD_5894 [Methylobacterium frigidaeris]